MLETQSQCAEAWNSLIVSGGLKLAHNANSLETQSQCAEAWNSLIVSGGLKLAHNAEVPEAHQRVDMPDALVLSVTRDNTVYLDLREILRDLQDKLSD